MIGIAGKKSPGINCILFISIEMGIFYFHMDFNGATLQLLVQKAHIPVVFFFFFTI